MYRDLLLKTVQDNNLKNLEVTARYIVKSDVVTHPVRVFSFIDFGDMSSLILYENLR